ncbi:sigma-54-dependent Fis family transcriptional regulator, partial [bacterium]|nr:sigma-54-dependent Fis family transcriptional regulator [bacterium]
REGLERIRASRPDLVMLDIWMPEVDGIETLKLIKSEFSDLPVIMMSGHGTIETAVKATKLGAFDFIEKPLSLDRLLVVLQNAFVLHELVRENRALRRQVNQHKALVGDSPAIQQIQELIRKVAPTTGSVLITGENGTGKELVAHGIHQLSPRFQKPFIAVNCAAIPEELIESELFGHERGAFTGATSLKRGKFDLANGGTLFLDEIADMSLKTQAKVLRILQEQKFERVGGQQSIEVDVRVVAATNKDLRSEIQKGQFREDLFYRLNVIPFHIPPLRERVGDISVLASHFLREFSQTHSKPPRVLSVEARRVLEGYPWPGNVRELRNFIERIVILSSDHEGDLAISASDLLTHLKNEVASPAMADLASANGPAEESSSVEGARKLRDARQDFEREFILRVLKEQEWNISKTASILGIERSHLHRKIKSFGIKTPDGA